MGGENSSEDIYKYCCGDSEDTETVQELERESKTPQSDDILLFEDGHKSLLNRQSNDALDSFLKHQFSDLTPEIIRAQGLDPLNEVWTDEVRAVLFKASIKVGPLTNLSQLIYDDLDLDEIDIGYDETLHLRTGLSVSIRIRDSESLNLILEAKIGINPKGTGIDLSLPAKGEVRVYGVKVKCEIGLVHSLDIEWNDRSKAIEGILNNNLSLKSIDISYERIVVSIIRQNIGDIAPMAWTKIEEAISKTITDIFKNQISKLLTKIMKKEMEKVLKQINDEVPRFAIEFKKNEELNNDEKNESESDDIHIVQQSKKHANKIINQLRKLKF